MAQPTAPMSRLDLNLLVALDALLTERSVTRAAEKLRLSQPALSASLSRLRVHFGDPLLTRDGNRYDFTPLAIRLAEQTGAALEATRRVFAAQAEWDPSESSREFSIYGSDHGLYVFGPTVAELAAERAPGVRFRFVNHNPTIVEDASNVLRSADGMLLPHGYINDLPYEDIASDGWSIIASADNDGIGATLTMEDMASSPWVFTYQSHSAFTPAGRQMQQLGMEPHIDLVVEGFLTLPSFVVGTRRLALIQNHLVAYALQHPGIRVFVPPFEATPITTALWWHPVHRRDPEHLWLRSLFAEAGRRISARD
jgi:LysR family transcriptional regulator, nod-box dependent transcriptional activator